MRIGRLFNLVPISIFFYKYFWLCLFPFLCWCVFIFHLFSMFFFSLKIFALHYDDDPHLVFATE